MLSSKPWFNNAEASIVSSRLGMSEAMFCGEVADKKITKTSGEEELLHDWVLKISKEVGSRSSSCKT